MSGPPRAPDDQCRRYVLSPRICLICRKYTHPLSQCPLLSVYGMEQATVPRWLIGMLERALREVAEDEGRCSGSGKVLLKEEAL